LSRTTLLPAIPMLLASLACYHVPSTQTAMWQHYQHVGEVQTAVIEGQLDHARDASRRVAEHDSLPGLPAEARPFELALRKQATAGAEAPDLAAAARATGRMGASCGACHQALQRGPRFGPMGSPEASDRPVSKAMLRHQWGADRMWDGLIGASDSAWVAGARAIADPSTYQELFNPRSARGESMRALAEVLQHAGRRAMSETDPERRAALHAEVLGTCSACHQLSNAKQ
jgi:cytochrome c556